MTKYTYSEFVDRTKNRVHGEGLFELENSRFLEMNLVEEGGDGGLHRGGEVYPGDVVVAGVGQSLKEGGESRRAQLTKAEGVGAVYLADTGNARAWWRSQRTTIRSRCTFRRTIP